MVALCPVHKRLPREGEQNNRACFFGSKTAEGLVVFGKQLFAPDLFCMSLFLSTFLVNMGLFFTISIKLADS
jgi:hypothetical protein